MHAANAGRTLLSQNAQELQAMQLELEGFVGLSGRCKVCPLILHPLQRWLQIAILDLRLHEQDPLTVPENTERRTWLYMYCLLRMAHDAVQRRT